MTKKKVTNGERYCHERKTWFMMCGNAEIPFRKLDAKGVAIRLGNAAG